MGATYLTAPLPAQALVETVSQLLADGRVRRQSPRKRIAPIEAYVDDTVVRINDISYEGARLEVPAASRPLPRCFTLRIIEDRLAVSAEWVWTAGPDTAGRGLVYGVKLAASTDGVSAMWRSLVDATPETIAWA